MEAVFSTLGPNLDQLTKQFIETLIDGRRVNDLHSIARKFVEYYKLLKWGDAQVYTVSGGFDSAGAGWRSSTKGSRPSRRRRGLCSPVASILRWSE